MPKKQQKILLFGEYKVFFAKVQQKNAAAG